MAPQPKTPGVYIVEKKAFPNAVVQVPTAVPVFIGYTERAKRRSEDVTGKPVRLSSVDEYVATFGGPPPTRVMEKEEDEKKILAFTENSRFLLYHGLRMFFDNGGTDCHVVSVGQYMTEGNLNPISKDALVEPLAEGGPLEKEAEPTMVVIPDAVLLSFEEWKTCSQKMLNHCIKMQSRVAILDVHGGTIERSHDEEDVITKFRQVTADKPNFGMAYYPWVNADRLSLRRGDVTLDDVDENMRETLGNLVQDAAQIVIASLDEADPTRKALEEGFEALVKDIKEDRDEGTEAEKAGHRLDAHRAALQIPGYRDEMERITKFLNEMPPAAAMAGVYARIDRQVGVFKAPANTTIVGVSSPVLPITDAEQEDLNVPFKGSAVNAIRSFIGRGVRVWGARTLDGNSQDWRYINVRRTAIMLEQSMKNALNVYVFEPNNASTWTSVRNMLMNFLDNQWKAGALMGATPEEAYQVDVGLGSTMTPNDVLDGYMKIAVRVALVRPAEFIILTFQQKLPTS